MRWVGRVALTSRYSRSGALPGVRGSLSRRLCRGESQRCGARLLTPMTRGRCGPSGAPPPVIQAVEARLREAISASSERRSKGDRGGVARVGGSNNAVSRPARQKVTPDRDGGPKSTGAGRRSNSEASRPGRRRRPNRQFRVKVDDPVPASPDPGPTTPAPGADSDGGVVAGTPPPRSAPRQGRTRQHPSGVTSPSNDGTQRLQARIDELLRRKRLVIPRRQRFTRRQVSEFEIPSPQQNQLRRSRTCGGRGAEAPVEAANPSVGSRHRPGRGGAANRPFVGRRFDLSPIRDFCARSHPAVATGDRRTWVPRPVRAAQPAAG